MLAAAAVQIEGRPHAVTVSEEGSVQVWDVEAGTERATLTGHTGSVSAVTVA
ncbi:hypothetical protein ACFXPN_47670 [Streptomyces griseorubiginosus]|uniref:hypothetical protein n=1 Tax=Streptomyces griseorubiginosus TaxID=67304 RepID=UPI0036898F4A